MSILFCKRCDKNIDTDFDAEHFNENEECIKWLDNQEITINKQEYIELKAVHDKLLLIYAKQTYRMDKLKASHERLKKAMPDVIALANLAYTPLTEKKTILECIQEDKRVVKTAQQALKQAQ